MKRIVALAVLLAALLVILTSCVLPSPDDILGNTQEKEETLNLSELNDAVLNSQRASVRIVAKSYSFTTVSSAQGSGVVFLERNGYYYALTNAHVLLDDSGNTPDSVRILDAYGAEYVAIVITVSEEQDLGIVRFEKRTNTLCTAPISAENIAKGRTVYSIGTPEGLINAVTYGKSYGYRDLTNDDLPISVLFHSCYVEHGSSGGGVFDANGNLVGINYAYGESVDSEDRYAFAIPAEEITAFLTECKLLPEGAN